jgi:hypothetical protein
MSMECDNCEMLSGELDWATDDLAQYKAKEFIDFIDSFGHVKNHFSSDYATKTKKEKELASKCVLAYEVSITAYMYIAINEKTFEIIALEKGSNFAEGLRKLYKKHFNRDFFEVSERQDG